MEERIKRLEVSIEGAQRDIDELRDILITLSNTINEIDKKITNFLDGKE